MLFHLWLSNIKRWRWRYLGIALLLAIGFVLFTLYNAFMDSAQNEGSLEKLDLPYDALVIAAPGERIYDHIEIYNLLPFVSVQETHFQGLIKLQEYAVATTVNSSVGAFSLLGLQSDYHYRSENLNLNGRYLAASGEIVLPQTLAEREGLQLGDSIALSVQEPHPWVPGVRYKSFTLVGTYDAYDLQPALISLEDALSLTADSTPNAALYTHDRNVRHPNITDEAEGFAWFMEWLYGVYPNATIIEAATSVKANEAMQSRLYRPDLGILFLIVLFTLIGTLTIAVMTYWERRREIASLKSIGISNRQLSLLMYSEFGLSGAIGLILGLVILTGLISQIDWLASLGFGALLHLCLPAGFCMIVSLGLATLYPIWTMRIASVHQLLYARSIPLRTTATDHMNRPDTELVYREREQNVRILRLFADEEMQGQILILKSIGDPVKQGETLAVRESFFGYAVHEWRAFCDGHIASIEVNGIIAITPDALDAPFYPYSASLLEFEQRRRKRFSQAVEEAPRAAEPDTVLSVAEREREAERVKERAWQRSYASPLMEEDAAVEASRAAASASKERTARSDKKQRSWSRYLKPALGLLGLAVLYIALNETLVYQRNLALYDTAEVQRGTLQQVLSYTGYLEPLTSKELRLNVDGRVTELLAADGDMVTKGQPLLNLSNLALQLAFSQAEQELHQTQLAYDTLRLRDEQGAAASEQELALMELKNSYEDLLQQQEALKIFAAFDGIVTKVTVRQGEKVSIGSTLLTFVDGNNHNPAEQEARLLQAKTQLDSCRARLDMLEVRAESDGFVAEISVVEGQSLSSGDSLLSIIKSSDQLSGDDLLNWQRSQLELSRLQKQTAGLLITAPKAGILSDVKLEVGEDVLTAQTIGYLQLQDAPVLTIEIPQHEVGEISLGDAVAIRGLSNSRSYSGAVQEIAIVGREDSANRRVTFDVRVSTENGSWQAFATGAEVRITSSSGREFGPYRAATVGAEQIELTAQVAGKVVELMAEKGDLLQAGQTIARLSNPDLELDLALQQRTSETLLLDEISTPLVATLEQVHVQPGEKVETGQLLMTLSNELLQAEWAQLVQAYEDLTVGIDDAEEETLRSKTAGTVSAFHVQPGQQVEAGQLLLELANPDLELQVKVAAAQMAKQEAALQAEQLNPGSGALARAALKLSQAEDRWHQAETAIQNLLITAPQDGRLQLSRPIRIGEELSAGTLIATIHQDDQLILNVLVGETQIGHFETDMPIYLRLSTFFEEEFVGSIYSISHEAELTEGEAVFRVRFVLPIDERLRVGMSASAHLLLDESVDALALPSEYLRLEKVGTELWTFANIMVGGKLTPVRVETGLKTDDYTEILSGLVEGEVVYREASR